MHSGVNLVLTTSGLLSLCAQCGYDPPQHHFTLMKTFDFLPGRVFDKIREQIHEPMLNCTPFLPVSLVLQMIRPWILIYNFWSD